jgi:hypothetical protein
LTSANVADNEMAPALIYQLPPEALFLLEPVMNFSMSMLDFGYGKKRIPE